MEFIAATFYMFGPAFIALVAVYSYNHYNKSTPDLSYGENIRVTTTSKMTTEKVEADGSKKVIIKEQVVEANIPASSITVNQQWPANQNVVPNLPSSPDSNYSNDGHGKDVGSSVEGDGCDSDIELSAPVTDAEGIKSSDEENIDVLGDSDGEE